MSSILLQSEKPKNGSELARYNRGPFRIFKHPLLQNIKKRKGPFGDFFEKKLSHNAEKN